MELQSVLLLGFLLGVKHAFDADHIVAISTIVGRTQRISETIRIGVLWGLGHMASLGLVGLAVLGLHLNIAGRTATFLEFLVACALIALGISSVWAYLRRNFHFHRHTHDEGAHFHLHQHARKVQSGHVHRDDTASHRHRHKSIALGVVHGLAGSAALMLLALTAADTFYGGLLYILCFSLGAVLGMAALGFLIGLPFLVSAGRFSRVNGFLNVAAGLGSVGLGFFLMIGLL
ncbi:MAG: urease accessory protein UreH [Terriglobia bacterium]